jgi:hypothetical protein
VIRIRNVLSLDGRRAHRRRHHAARRALPGLTEKIFLARDNTIYHLYQSRYGINVLRTDERLRAVLADAEDARCWRRRGAPLLEIRRVALTFRDRPVELRVSRVDTATTTTTTPSARASPSVSAALLILPNFVLIVVGLALARRFDYGREFWEGWRSSCTTCSSRRCSSARSRWRRSTSRSRWLVGAACAFTIAGFALSLARQAALRPRPAARTPPARSAAIASTPTSGLAVAGSLFG